MRLMFPALELPTDGAVVASTLRAGYPGEPVTLSWTFQPNGISVQALSDELHALLTRDGMTPDGTLNGKQYTYSLDHNLVTFTGSGFSLPELEGLGYLGFLFRCFIPAFESGGQGEVEHIEIVTGFDGRDGSGRDLILEMGTPSGDTLTSVEPLVTAVKSMGANCPAVQNEFADQSTADGKLLSLDVRGSTMYLAVGTEYSYLTWGKPDGPVGSGGKAASTTAVPAG